MSDFRLPPFYPILDTAALAAKAIGALDAARAVLGEGAKIIQYRHKAIWTQEVFDEAAEIARLCAEAGALLAVNDRVDYAKLLGTAVHLGGDDLSPFAARRVLGSDAVIGFSTHNAFQVKRASEEQVQYLALGPIFSTTSKANPDPVVGIEGLSKCRSLTTKPLVAIGGITMEQAAAVLQAGADSIAVISGLLGGDSTLSSLRERTKAWVAATRL
ncbi:MAG: thiamine phosphate synthase [Bryobacteraceae bacterium]